MVRTRVGYAGGSTDSPTYTRLADHTETIAIDFDPRVVTYGELLDVFFAEHRPLWPAYGRQYRSAIFHHDEDQERIAREKILAMEQELDAEIHTDLEPAGPFWRAEDYHQKYSLRRIGPLLDRVIEREGLDWVDSTLASRLNAFAGGCLARDSVIQDLRDLGASEEQIADMEGVLAACGR